MAMMTEEEADYWDEYYTKNPPKVNPEGKGFFARNDFTVVSLDDLSSAYLSARAEATHKTPSQLIGELVRQAIGKAAML